MPYLDVVPGHTVLRSHEPSHLQESAWYGFVALSDLAWWWASSGCEAGVSSGSGKAFRLLIAVLSIADARRRERSYSGSCSHW
ncbi:DUF5958 family protein [Streptomyces sp. Ncost-T6T-1]|uniref:DUF5958 family protein n=1 Tax=Streptomyces sp. Ncost-T6T-1 TaxID=1100828 RepID=UPI001EFA3BCF|nr:DUF5958 family protein [Streptomyces sp. Ncost-T6T-1]